MTSGRANTLVGSLASRVLVRTLSIVAGISAVGTLHAQPPTNGSQFQINTYTLSDQGRPAVASDAAGNFVVAWQSAGSDGSDSSDYSVRTQWFTASGVPLGDQFQANAFTTGFQGRASVAVSPIGSFVVAWHSQGSGGSDSSGNSIQARRFLAGGVPAGPEFQVNTYTPDHQVSPTAGMDGSGNFVVVWQSSSCDSLDPTLCIQGQRFAADGTFQGPEFLVNSYTTGEQRRPAIAVGATGEFVVVWESLGSGGSDHSGWSIQARQFSAGGIPGPQFQVNSITSFYQVEPAVAVGADGGFLVSWESDFSAGQDTSFTSIQGQRFSADGTPEGGQFEVNTLTTGFQEDPSVVLDPDGSFWIAWSSDVSAGPDLDNSSVQLRGYSGDGLPHGVEFQVNSYSSNRQDYPVVAADAHGDLVVVWESLGADGSDSEGWSVQGQRFDQLFRDSFESGDTNRWSGTTP